VSRSLLAFRDSPIAYPTSSVWRAVVNYITDGDTLWVERDTGCRESQLIELRVTGYQWKGFNAAERFTEAGKLATAEVKRACPIGTVIRIETQPDTEKFGRWLSPVLIPFTKDFLRNDGRIVIDGENYVDLAAWLVANIPGCVWKDY
jgi:hypothetical protein